MSFSGGNSESLGLASLFCILCDSGLSSDVIEFILRILCIFRSFNSFNCEDSFFSTWFSASFDFPFEISRIYFSAVLFSFCFYPPKVSWSGLISPLSSSVTITLDFKSTLDLKVSEGPRLIDSLPPSNTVLFKSSLLFDASILRFFYRSFILFSIFLFVILDNSSTIL